MSHSAPDYAVEMMALPSPGYIEEVTNANRYSKDWKQTAVVVHFRGTHKYSALAESSLKRIVMDEEFAGRTFPGRVVYRAVSA